MKNKRYKLGLISTLGVTAVSLGLIGLITRNRIPVKETYEPNILKVTQPQSENKDSMIEIKNNLTEREKKFLKYFHNEYGEGPIPVKKFEHLTRSNSLFPSPIAEYIERTGCNYITDEALIQIHRNIPEPISYQPIIADKSPYNQE